MPLWRAQIYGGKNSDEHSSLLQTRFPSFFLLFSWAKTEAFACWHLWWILYLLLFQIKTNYSKFLQESSPLHYFPPLKKETNKKLRSALGLMPFWTCDSYEAENMASKPVLVHWNHHLAFFLPSISSFLSHIYMHPSFLQNILSSSSWCIAQPFRQQPFSPGNWPLASCSNAAILLLYISVCRSSTSGRKNVSNVVLRDCSSANRRRRLSTGTSEVGKIQSEIKMSPTCCNVHPPSGFSESTLS